MRIVLTERQEEVLGLVARGYRDKEIAEKMGLGVSTVKTHIKNAMQTLKARTKAQAVFNYYGAVIIITGVNNEE